MTRCCFDKCMKKKHNYRATKRKRMLNGLPSSPVSGGGTPFPRNPRPTAVFPKAPDGREKGQRLPCKRAAITLQKSRNHIAKGQRSHCKRTAVAVQKAGNHIAKACKANCVRSVHGSMAMVHCALPPWRLVFLEGRGASEASYPA